MEDLTEHAQIQNNKKLLIFKLFSIIVFFFITRFVGVNSYKNQILNRNTCFQNVAVTFSGGIFLNLALLHMLPEASKNIQVYLGEQMTLPWGEMLVMIGFLMTILLTKVINNQNHTHKQQLQNNYGNTFDTFDKIELKQYKHCFIEQDSSKNSDHANLESKEELNNKKDILMFTLAINIHALIQGITLGIQHDKIVFMVMGITILSHKWIQSFSIGLLYKQNKLSEKLAYKLINLQSCVSAFSILIGYFISEINQLFQSILMALSAGTFIAFSLTHILNHSLDDKKYICYKFISLILSTMIILLSVKCQKIYE